jgi:hypothetical protein
MTEYISMIVTRPIALLLPPSSSCSMPAACCAAELVSDVANGGQILLDEPTFLLIKDSLTVLGTVNDAGFDDSMLQQLLQAKVVGRLQEQLACYCRL